MVLLRRRKPFREWPTEHLQCLAFADIRAYLRKGSEGETLVPLAELTEAQRACLKVYSDRRTKDRRRLRLVFHDRGGAMRELGRRLGLGM